MSAAKIYPFGIGKHIVCIDADRSRRHTNACRGEPRTPNIIRKKQRAAPACGKRG